MKQDSQCAGLGDQIVRRVLNSQGGFLRFSASKASSRDVTELLRRLVLHHSKDKRIPCCTAEADLADLAAPLEAYTWQDGEASPH